MTEVWSNRYGRKSTASNGLHNILFKKKKGYKKSKLQKYITGFSEFIGKPEKHDNPSLAQNNFKKWLEYIDTLTY